MGSGQLRTVTSATVRGERCKQLARRRPTTPGPPAGRREKGRDGTGRRRRADLQTSQRREPRGCDVPGASVLAWPAGRGTSGWAGVDDRAGFGAAGAAAPQAVRRHRAVIGNGQRARPTQCTRAQERQGRGVCMAVTPEATVCYGRSRRRARAAGVEHRLLHDGTMERLTRATGQAR